MEKQGLFSELTMKKIKKVRKVFLWTAVWILIAEVVLGAILILTQSWSVPIGKIQGSFLIAAVVLFVGVNNFIRIEKGSRSIQMFALVSLVGNIVWALLAMLLLWEITPFFWIEEIEEIGYRGRMYTHNEYHMTVWAIAMLVFAYAGSACFWISNVMSIKETVKMVRPLKITALVCVAYCWVFGTIVTIVQPEFEEVDRLSQLAGLAGLAFGVTALVALIISKVNKKKVIETETVAGAVTPSMTKSEAELRAEIEEKVRREMMEKEVRGQVLTAQAPAEQTETGEQANTTGQVVTGEKVVEHASAVTQTASQPGHTGQVVTEQMPVEQQVVTTEQVMAEQKGPEQVGGDGGATEGAKRENAIIEESFGNKGN